MSATTGSVPGPESKRCIVREQRYNTDLNYKSVLLGASKARRGLKFSEVSWSKKISMHPNFLGANGRSEGLTAIPCLPRENSKHWQ